MTISSTLDSTASAAVNAATAAASTAAIAANGAGTSSTSAYAKLGVTDFLKLLTTELKDQDPTQPMDNAAMVAQLATFSQLSSTNAGDTTLSAISTTLDSIQASQLAAQQSAAAASAAGPNTTTA
jgi:flagellar basal-body rod modification protein FlgD